MIEEINFLIAIIIAVVGGTFVGWVLAQIMFHTVMRLVDKFSR